MIDCLECFLLIPYTITPILSIGKIIQYLRPFIDFRKTTFTPEFFGCTSLTFQMSTGEEIVFKNKEIGYKEIEKLSQKVQLFIKGKGFEILDEFEFLTKLEKVLWENIDKKI